MGRLIGVVHEALVAGFGLAKDLDDLDAADVLHRSVVESLGGNDRVLIKLCTARHHEHIAEHSQRHRGQRGQAHTPVHDEDIDQDDNGDQQIGRKLRHDVGQSCLNGVDALDEGVLQRAGALLQNSAQGHSCQLLHAFFADLTQHGKSCPVARGGGQGMKHYPPQPERRHDQATAQIEGKVLHPVHQPLHDADHHKVRRQGKSHADDCQDHAQNILSPVVTRLPQYPGHGRLGLFHFLHKQTSRVFVS